MPNSANQNPSHTEVMTQRPPGSPQRLPVPSRRRAARASALTPEPVIFPDPHPSHETMPPAPQIIHGGNLFSLSEQSDLSPRLFAYLQRGFFEIVPGYSLRMLDIWMIIRDAGPFHLQAYRSNGTPTAVIVTKVDEQLIFQWTDSRPLQIRELQEVSCDLESLLYHCRVNDNSLLSSVHFPPSTPYALQHALQRQLPEQIHRDNRCAALIQDGLPLVTVSVVDGREYWLILFKLGYDLHVRLAESLGELTLHKQHLQALGLWPTEAPPSTR